ncbi:MAG: hypothetical protein JSW23_00480 [Planctomycetota bacterium]|nr:MAG: hypothetical protein JSW23_00480 [Planctomycetota bacterium]
MAVKRISVHCVEIEDKPGSLRALLSKAASKKVDFLGFVACSSSCGSGCVCLSAKNPAALEACAKEAGIKATPMTGFLISGADKVGVAAADLKGLADAGINGVAGAAMVCDGQYQMLIVVSDSDGDAAAAALGA